jgi:hypothetical protein
MTNYLGARHNCVFDPELHEHQKSYTDWWAKPENRKKPNIWKEQKNSEGVDMCQRIEDQLFAPGHAEFYKDKIYGAIVGRHFHAGLVIIDKNLAVALEKVASPVSKEKA